MIVGEEKEVMYSEYCKKCLYFELDETEDPCNECLTYPVNENSIVPINFKEKEVKVQ